MLHLLVSEPQHLFKGTQEINPVLAMQIDRGGLSVLREGASDAEFVSTFEALKANAASKGSDRYL